MKRVILMLMIVGVVSIGHALEYNFDTDAEGFQNVAWQPDGSVQQTHTAGGWQMLLTKEFLWEAGGGSDNQQLAMQALANDPAAKIEFDIWVDGGSFPPGVADWYNFNVVGNSDGAAGWTQTDDLFTISGWHDADDPTLFSMHIEMAFSAMGWEPGDTWFQLYTGTNSGDVVNFYLDNVLITPEPATLALLGLGALVLRRRK